MTLEWRCTICTFINRNPSSTICNICNSTRTNQENTMKRKHEIIVITDSPPPTRSKPKLDKMNNANNVFQGRITTTCCPGSKSKFNIKDLIVPGIIRVFVSSFCIDDEWFMSLLPRDIPICIARPRPNDVPVQIEAVTMSRYIQYIFPKMAFQYGAMHIKLMILWYPEYIRIVIPSANLMEYDWTMIENVVFYQDFKKGQHHSSTFSVDLENVLSEMGVPMQVLHQMYGYDYSNALGTLIASKPGIHSHMKWGLAKMKSVVQGLDLELDQPKVSSQGSSMGSLQPRWCNEFYSACTGLDTNDSTNLSILFPTKQTVYESILGPQNGGTIMFQSKYWNQKSFPKSIIRNTKSITNGLMHSKIIICTNEEKDSEIDIYAKDVFDGYIYCGSHNTTQSAWGTWTVKEPRKLKITNWELGIVFPFSWGPGFQIPFEYPAPCYQSGDEPWCIHDFAKNS